MNSLIDHQLQKWELASKNYKDLQFARIKKIKIGDLEVKVQCNPARAVSTLAKVESRDIKSRPCFLCSANRPAEQDKYEILPGWDLLVNPYPILPFHFTIASTSHTPQHLYFEEGKKLAERLPGMVVFYNDSGAGASAPDHLHFQAVPLEELPLIRLLKDNEPQSLRLPFKIYTEEKEIKECKYPQNAYFWKDGEGVVKMISIPRKAHRPESYFKSPPLRRAFSPGAIDMAGVLVTPFEEDFEATDSVDIINIYQQTAFSE